MMMIIVITACAKRRLSCKEIFRKFNILPHDCKCYQYCLLWTTKKIFKQTDVHKTDMTFTFHLITSVNVNNTGHEGTNNTEVCLHTICCCGKAVSITYSKCMSVPLVIQHACKAHVLYNTVICGLSGCTIFSHIIS
jgi:hypothetical protein